ncbi:DSN1 protein, partial [Rhinopomastus cyanomelas]|nr:DSN1 protein [Rhinopomastus cyanomelas]
QRKRRSWRRSSLKGTKRRQSLPPIHQDITGLSKSISLGLPEPDRLSALLLSSFQFSVQKLQQILQGDSSFKPEAFQAQAQSVSEELKHHLQKLQQDGTLRGCTEDPSGQPPPPELEKSVAQVKDFIARFSAECQAWDQLLLGYQQGSEEAARRLEQSRSSAKQAEPVPHLQTSQAQVLRSKPNYRQILQEQGQVLSCMELLLDELQQALKLLGAFSEESQQVLQRLSRRLAARTFQQLEGSPARRLLVAPPKKGP